MPIRPEFLNCGHPGDFNETSEKYFFNADIRGLQWIYADFTEENIGDHPRVVCENLRLRYFFRGFNEKPLTKNRI
jgi:hypothetical protein